MKKSVLDWVALILVIIGAVDWGLVGLGSLLKANLNVVNLVLGGMPALESIVYILVGLAGLYTIYYLIKD
jgi:uncharacterized protein